MLGWIIGILAVIIIASVIYLRRENRHDLPNSGQEPDSPAESTRASEAPATPDCAPSSKPQPTTVSSHQSAFPPSSNKPKYTFIDDPVLDGAVGSDGVKVYYSRVEFNYWQRAQRKLFDLAHDGKYREAYEHLAKIFETKDHYECAYELYRLVDFAIYELYPMRNLEGCTDLILDLGKRGFDLIDGYIEVARQYTVWRFPTQIAIILEKSGKIEEAIELCKFLEERNVRDNGYNTFAARRLKLEEKLKKRK